MLCPVERSIIATESCKYSVFHIITFSRFLIFIMRSARKRHSFCFLCPYSFLKCSFMRNYLLLNRVAFFFFLHILFSAFFLLGSRFSCKSIKYRLSTFTGDAVFYLRACVFRIKFPQWRPVGPSRPSVNYFCSPTM